MKYKQIMHRNQFFISTILHCTYSFCHGGSRYTPCHYILNKGLTVTVQNFVCLARPFPFNFYCARAIERLRFRNLLLRNISSTAC